MTDLTAPHHHLFLGAGHIRNERRTWIVIALTTTMMVAEIVAGTLFGSMALLADGWHMATHAGAMLIAALAYLYARRRAVDDRYSFGTGKIGDLAGFASALLLAAVALVIAGESVMRFYAPIRIDFTQATLVAVIGLTVNLASAWLLHEDHGHHHGTHDHHGHEHGPGTHDHHDHEHPAGRDNNLRGAYLHVLADALTSVLAITALLLGALFGWSWLDPAIGVLGALVIARWSWGLMRDTGRVLVDYASVSLREEIKRAMETSGDEIADLHVWQLGPGHHGAIISLRTANALPLALYRAKLSHIEALSHVTIEIDRKAI
jgi:cation diffusion facilitator family transporter